MTDPAEEGHLVLLETHPRPRPKPSRRRAELALDLLGGDRQAGGEAFDDDDEALAV